MDWPNEDYVRIYTRETADDLDLSWEALALWRAMLIKFDKAGVIMAKNGWVSIARVTRIPVDVVERAGDELVKDGRIKLTRTGFFAPNFTDAQTASKSDRLRQKECRDRRRETAESQIIELQHLNVHQSRAVTDSHVTSPKVTLTSALPPDTDPDPPPLPNPILPPQASAKKIRAQQDRKFKLPDDWRPTKSDANLAAEEAAMRRGINLPVELDKLRDWAQSNNAKKSDWDATWRNWTRNAKPSNPRASGSGDGLQYALAVSRGELP